MTVSKAPSPGQEEESFAVRLRELIGKRSIRAAAKAWQLSYSTLNNYINRGTEPSIGIAMQIARLEGVSVEWLAYGKQKQSPQAAACEEERAAYRVSASSGSNPLQLAWSMVFSSIDEEEQAALLKLIHKEGVKGILQETRMRSDLMQKIAALTAGEREHFYAEALALIATMKKQ